MNRGVSGYIGEHYVMIELLRNGFDAYFPPSSTQDGWDIMVLKNDKEIKIQVKIIDWSSQKSSKTIRGDFKNGNFNYLAVVFMNFGKTTRYRTLIIPKEKILQKCGGNSQDFIDNNYNILHSIPKKSSTKEYSITMTKYKQKNIRAKVNEKYLNKWNLIN